MSVHHSPYTKLGPEIAAAELDTLVSNVGFDQMAALFGEPELPQELAARLAILSVVADENWQKRNGAERQDIVWGDDQLNVVDSPVWNTIFAAATSLGMVESSLPVNRTPDYLIVPGGANRAPLHRLSYGLESVDHIRKGVAYLGASRKVSPKEREIAGDYAFEPQTEFDLGCGAIQTLLSARLVDEEREPTEDDEKITRWYEYDHEGETKQAFAINAPKQPHANRATTYDNFGSFADVTELSFHPDVSAVSVTTGHYRLAQHICGLHVLTADYGTRLETIGHSAAYSAVPRMPSQLVQELKAAVDAAIRLNEKLTQPA